MDPHYGRIVEDCNEESFLEMTMIIPMHGNISSVYQIRRIWKQVMSFLQTDSRDPQKRNEDYSDGVFNHCGSLISGWTENVFMRTRKDIQKELMFPQTVLIGTSSLLMT